MAEYRAESWEELTAMLTKSYGPDATQEGICRTLEALGAGNTEAIANRYAYAVTATRNYLKDQEKLKANTKNRSLGAVMDAVAKGMHTPESLINGADPESIHLDYEREYQIQALREAYYERCATGSPSQRLYWRKQYQEAVRELDYGDN